MPNNVAASMTASIVIDKSDLLAQILKGLSEGQKELENNKLEMYFDFSDSKNKAEFEKTLQKYKKQLASNDFVVKITNEGIEETVKSLDKLLDVVKSIASGKGFGTGNGNGNGIGNSIVDENQLKTVIDLFTKMESNLASIKKIFVDVGDGEEFSPLFSMINKINSSISELSSSVKGIGLNMNIDVGSDTELEAKIQSKMSNALQAYQRLFEHIKMSGVGGSMVNTNFFEFDINQFDTMMAKIQAYRKFIENMRNQVKSEFGGKDLLYTETDKKYWTSVAAAMGQLTKAQNEMNKSADANPLDNLFGKTDLTGVIEQLNLIVSKLDEISVTATKFSETFSQGLNVTTSVEEVSKLTEKVKELETELAKVKSVSTSSDDYNSKQSKEQAKAADEAIKRIDALNNSITTLNNIHVLPELSSQFSKLKKDVDNLNAKLQNDEIGIEEYKKSFNTLVSDYMKLNDIQQRRDVETYNENAKRALQEEKEQAKALETEWKNNADAIEKYENAVIKLNNLKASDKGTGKKSNEIQEQQKVVDKLKQNADEAKDKLVELFNIDVNNPDVSKWNEFVELLKKSGLETDEVAQSFAKLNDSIKNAKDSVVNSIQSDIDGYNKKLANISATPADFNQSEKYKANLAELKEQISQFETFRDKIASQDTITEEDIQSIAKYKSNIEEATRAITSMTAAEKGSTSLSRDKLYNKIGDYMKKNSGLSKQFRVELQKLQKQLTMRGANANVSDLTDEFLKLQIRIREAGEEGKKFWDVVKEKAWYGAASQIGMAFGVNDIIRYGQNAINVVRELDTAYTEMRKVSDETEQSLKNYQKTTFDTADAVGTTAMQIQNSTADFMRLGEAMDDAAESARTANILFNVSEFDNIEDATSSLISMQQAYKDLDKITIVDKLNEVGNNYAISTDELASALQRSAATLSLMGNTIDEAASLVTTANATIQDADSVAAGLRTISLRLVGTSEAEEELSAMNEEVDAFVKATNSKKQQIIKDYTAVASNNYQGFDILDDNGNYKNTYEILLGIARVYREIQEQDKKLGTNHATALIEELAGKNRSNIASAILQDPDQLEAVRKSSEEAFGSAEKELDKYLDSIDGRLQQLTNKAQELASVAIDDDLIKNGITLATKFLDLVTNIVDKMGLIPTLATGIGAALSLKNVGRDIMYSLFEYADNIHNLLWIQRFRVCYS
jgi:TP901 family phage tail tape measure protein